MGSLSFGETPSVKEPNACASSLVDGFTTSMPTASISGISDPAGLFLATTTAHGAFTNIDDGNDLRIDLSITLYEAVLGAKVRVPTPDGAVELSIPKNTSSGRTFRLKGKGMPHKGGRGDLFVATRIILPDGHDAEDRMSNAFMAFLGAGILVLDGCIWVCWMLLRSGT